MALLSHFNPLKFQVRCESTSAYQKAVMAHAVMAQFDDGLHYCLHHDSPSNSKGHR